MQKHKISLITLAILFVLYPAIAIKAISPVKPLAKIVVEAGQYTRIDTPVSVSLEGIIADPNQSRFMLMEVKGTEKVSVASQIEPVKPSKLWWILTGTTPAGGKREYELLPGGITNDVVLDTGIVKVVKDDKVLVLQKGDRKVLQYNHAIVPAPEDMGRRVPEVRRPLYDRSGFIHPLWSPDGLVLTDIHPADHIHHMGIWMPWTHTKYEGRRIDFWNVGDGTGTVQFDKFLSETSGPVYGGFQAGQEHVTRKRDPVSGRPTPEVDKVILREVWDVRVYNVGGPEKGYWLVDFKSIQRNVAENPLIQEEYRYGGLGYRATRQWKGENTSYLTSEGKTRENANGTRARWCDTAGVIDGKWTGITHYSHPQNFRHPETMRVWPEPDNYIFFNFCPSVLGEWEMAPGEDHVFQYRFYVHEGKISTDDAERIWHDYAEPPVVQLEKINQ
jgi:hypothetical protein